MTDQKDNEDRDTQMPADTGTVQQQPELDAEGWPVGKSPVTDSTPRLLAMLAHALLQLGFNRIPLATRQRMISFFGMVALITPLILWVSWTKTMLLVFSGIGVLCVAALLIIVWLSPEDEL